MTVEIIKPSSRHWQMYRDLILNALQEQPRFLALSHHLALAKTDHDWQTYLEKAATETEYILRWAMAGDRLVGTAKLSLEEPGCYYDHVATLGTLYVDPGYRQQGMATQLIQALLSAAPAHGLKTVVTYTREDNQSALKLLQALGFELRGTLRQTARAEEGYKDELVLQTWL